MRGNTTSTAKDFVRNSRGARSATSGNKNVRARASRKGMPVPKGAVGRAIKGPDLGAG